MNSIQSSRTDGCRLGPRRGVGESTLCLTEQKLPLRELEKEMLLSSGDGTQVVTQARVGKLVRCRAKVTARPHPCLVAVSK